MARPGGAVSRVDARGAAAEEAGLVRDEGHRPKSSARPRRYMLGRMRPVAAVSLLLLALSTARAVAAPGELPAGYQVVNATPLGRALSAQKPGVTTVKAALLAAFRDLTKLYGVRPTVASAYEDSRDHHSGNATFFANVGGWPTKGVVFCKIDRKRAVLAVIYGRSDMSPGEWTRLSTSQAAAQAPPEAPPAAETVSARESPDEGPIPQPAHAKLRAFRFPDDTGTVGLAEGWSTKAQSSMGGFVLDGPAGQNAMVGVAYSVATPTSTLRRFSPLVAPFTTPVEAFGILVPQMSRVSQQHGGSAFELDHLVERHSAKSWSPRGRASFLSFGLTETGPNGRRHLQALSLVQIIPTSQQGFMLTTTTARAPDASFHHDLPLMLQMINSYRENAAVITQKSNQQLAAKNQWFAAQQSAMRQKQQSFDAQLQSQERASNARLRQADDFDEVIRGVRTVEDTRTGEKTSVDLGNVDKIVDGANQADPGRYRQIPLRDEAHPEE